MHHLFVALLCFACTQASAADARRTRELVYPFPGTGPVEVAGTASSSKVLRTMQRYVVPAFSDVLAAHVASTLQGASGEPIVLERKPRQAGNEASNAVAFSPPDGRTLLLTNGPGLHSGTQAQLRPVALVATMPYVLVVTGDSVSATVGKLIRHSGAHRSRTLIATAGEHTTAQSAVERLRSRFQVDPVAYNGGNAALNAILTTQVSTALVPLPAVLPSLKAGRVKALLIAQSRRHAAIPDVETSTEAGVAELEAIGWFGVFAPAATPRSIINALDSELTRVSAPAEPRALFIDMGLELEHRPADAFAKLLVR